MFRMSVVQFIDNYFKPKKVNHYKQQLKLLIVVYLKIIKWDFLF